MKYTVTCALLLTLISLAGAQPVLTRSHLMIPGDEFFVASVSLVPDPGPAGANVEWDFSSLQQTGSTNFSVEEAQSTQYTTEFPGANIAFVDPPPGSPFFQYQFIDESGWEDHGNVSPGFSTLIYDDPRLTLQFPLTFNTQWQDAFEYSIAYLTNPPVTTLGEGTLNARVDGYGSLVLPQATFDDVLRLRIISMSTDTSELGSGLYERNDFLDTTFVWFSPSYHAALCTYFSSHIMRTTTVISGGDTLNFPEVIDFSSFSFDPAAEPSSANHDLATPGRHELNFSPNPFGEALRLEFLSDEVQDMQFVLQDLFGNSVFQQNIESLRGSNLVEINLPELPSGVYVGLLYSAEGTDVQQLIHIEDNR